IDAITERPFLYQRRHADQQESYGDGKKELPFAEPIDLYVLKYLNHELTTYLRHRASPACSREILGYSSDADGFCALLTGQHHLKKGPGHKHSGEHVGNQSDHQRDRKTLHGARPKEKQESGRYQGRQMRVDQSDEHAIEAGRHSRSRRLAGAEFLTD